MANKNSYLENLLCIFDLICTENIKIIFKIKKIHKNIDESKILSIHRNG